jgi:hypothetical protein
LKTAFLRSSCGSALLGLALFQSFAGVTPARAGAWLQPVGDSFVKATVLRQSSDERWDCRGGVIPADPAGAFEQTQWFVYGEHGLLEWLTLTGSWAYKDQQIDGDQVYGTRSSGDLRLGSRVPLLRGSRPVSLEATLSFPTYERSELRDPPALRKQYLPAGSGRFESEIHALAGASLWPLPLYLNGDLGFRSRGGDFEDQWLVALEIGGSSPYFFAKNELRWAIPLDERCEGDLAAGTLALHERMVSISPELAARLKGRFWVTAGYSHPISGRNGLTSGVWSLGLIFRDS